MRTPVVVLVLLAAVIVIVLLTAARAPLSTFNMLVAKDAGSKRLLTNVAYGSMPRQKLDIYVPTARPAARRLPVIIFFYGGAWTAGDRADYGFVGRGLAAQGFVVVIPDYRLVPEARFPAFVEDAAASVRWVRAHIGAVAGGDPDRIIVSGHSAGAYNAAMLAVDPCWLGRDHAAIRGFIGLAGPYDFAPFDDPAAVAAFGQWHDPRATQPVAVAARGAPPALLASGDEDGRVRPRNSDALAEVLTRLGTIVERRRYAGIDHVRILVDLAKPLRGRTPIFDDVVAFAHAVTGTSQEQKRSSMTERGTMR
jgi:acetyl esterase/lipase